MSLSHPLLFFFFFFLHSCSWREQLPTPVFLSGESHGQRSLAGNVHGIAKSQIRLSDFDFSLFLKAPVGVNIFPLCIIEDHSFEKTLDAICFMTCFLPRNLWAGAQKLGLWTVISFSWNNILPYKLRTFGGGWGDHSLGSLAWNHHFMRWGKGDLTRTPVFSVHHTYSRSSALCMDVEGKGVSHLSPSFTQDLASAAGTWEQDEKADTPLLGRNPSSECCGERELCVLCCSGLEYFTERGRRERYCFKYQTHLSYQFFIDVLE